MINVKKMFGKSRFIKVKELQSFVFIVTIFYALEFFVSLKERMMFYSRFSFDGR